MRKQDRRNLLIGAVKGVVKGDISDQQIKKIMTDLFESFGISNDFEEQSNILIGAMGNPKVGFCGQPTPEEKYETLLSIYLYGNWQEYSEEE
jgi:hypothetical protein